MTFLHCQAGMVDFSNRWKFLSFGLMAILATGLLAPQAFADMTTSILSITQNIQSQVNNPNYGLQAINNHVTNSNNAINSLKPNSIAFINATRLGPLGQPTDDLQVVFLQSVANKTYAGHMTMSIETFNTTSINLVCDNPGGSIVLYSNLLNGIDHVNLDFACQSFSMSALNKVSSTTLIQISGVIQYQNSTNVSTKLPVFLAE